MIDTRPIILTAVMDAKAQSFFDEKRTRHFPSERNWLDAHITLFHALPGRYAEQIAAVLGEHVATGTIISATVTGPKSLGRGVAYMIESVGLKVLQQTLSEAWSDWLRPQDRQTFKPHVTVQNKVTNHQALATTALLQAEFVPFAMEIGGIAVWRYDGGPWDRQAEYAFEARHP